MSIEPEDAERMIVEWHECAARATDAEDAARFTRLATQLQDLIDTDRISFSSHRHRAVAVELWQAQKLRPTKLCLRCGAVKPLSAFAHSVLTEDGRREHCKVCGMRKARK